ncbi:GTPase [Muricauda sp. 2012CJ35-5]|uniref:GTPase n=1 Tax=Flagellimonas spongiicola TaxID=2942208 RepID=A0ABT0PUJ9_9FLAO|nr:GTPase [Allomuricauda spongiicola]MCL6275078.1 GTPase [Allomuricauda spongiicola]
MEEFKLLFVYNANSGKRNALLDTVHKVFSPSTYQCRLCDITYGLMTEKKEWKNFRKTSGIQMEFLHKDEFFMKYGHNFGYPAIIRADKNGLQELISSEELAYLSNPSQLIDLIMEKISNQLV